jgi:hypothetical protein
VGYIYFQIGGDDANRRIETTIDTPNANLNYGKYICPKSGRNDIDLIYSNKPIASNTMNLSLKQVEGIGVWYSIYIKYSGTFSTHKTIWRTKDAILLAQVLSNRYTFRSHAYYAGTVIGTWNKVYIRIDMYKENIYGVKTALFNSPNTEIFTTTRNVVGNTNSIGSISSSDKIVAKISGAYLLYTPP